jgi:hypothetical protein
MVKQVKKKDDERKTFTFPNSSCPKCSKPIYSKDYDRDKVAAILIGSETIEDVWSVRKVCSNHCHSTVRCNLLYVKGGKQNCMTFNQMAAQGAYFVTDKTAFTMKYLELCYLRLMRARNAPGQEAVVQEIFHEFDNRTILTPIRFRDHLLHAMEGYAGSRRDPFAVIKFDVDYPAKAIVNLEDTFMFPPTSEVTEVCFDGHFGINRMLQKGVEPDRTVRRAARPAKKLKPHERSCSCARKDYVHCALPNRTAGWQFVVDPSSRRVLAAKEHKVNECNADKLDVVKDVLKMHYVNADVLIHDDACHFEPHAKKYASLDFQGIEYYMIDVLHQQNHKCTKRTWTRREKKRMEGVRTNMAESFNAWVRPLNFFLNGLRPHSHRFWVQEMCVFYNDHLKNVPLRITRRTNAAARKVIKKPAAALVVRKKPAAALVVRKKPAASLVARKRPAAALVSCKRPAAAMVARK